MERDEKGRFLKGSGPINKDVAREYQLRSAEKRKEKRALADVVRAALAEKVAKGSSMSKLEYLTYKALENHAKGEMTFKDLRELQKILGEDVKTVNLNGPLIVSADEMNALSKWSAKE